MAETAETAQTIEFVVTGEETIHCASCEQRIANALRRLPGVQDVRASHQTQRVAVTIDGARVSPDEVRSRLELVGYQVEPAGAPGPAA